MGGGLEKFENLINGGVSIIGVGVGFMKSYEKLTLAASYCIKQGNFSVQHQITTLKKETFLTKETFSSRTSYLHTKISLS